MRRNIGSRITPAAARQATMTSTGGLPNPTGIKTVSSRGSSAGLRNQKSVRLEHNSGGYLNPAHQTARRGKPPTRIPRMAGSAAIQRSGGSILDKRLTKFTDSSIALLLKRI